MTAALVFAAGAAFLAYVLAGYPVLLALRSRERPEPGRSRLDVQEPSVTVLLAVRNGERWIRNKLRSILALDYPRRLLQILVISDGSDDATEAAVREFAAEGVELIAIPRGGKASALNAGMASATGDILFFTDVRQPLDRAAVRHLTASLADPHVGVVSGELVILDGASQAEANTGLYWRYEKWIRQRQSRIDSMTGATGCIYAMRRELAVPLPPNTILDDMYLPAGALLRGSRVVWNGAAKAYDDPAPLGAEFRRKVRTQAGVYQLLRYYPQLLSPVHNRIWIHFVSHKLGRLLAPFALLAMAVSSYWLPPYWMGAQAAFYLAAAADPLIPESSAVKRLTSPARTFVVLMAAALCAASIVFVPETWFWKDAWKSARSSRTEARQ
ncbi:MAG: glycosyltransferase family 2 protein [Bryobacteraceae bacterium]